MSVVRVDRCFVAKQNLIADVTWVSNGVFKHCQRLQNVCSGSDSRQTRIDE